MTIHTDSTSREEWRAETCPDCHQPRERAWTVREQQRGTPVPGWHVARSRRSGSWRMIARPTRFVTLCLCDA